MKTKFSIPLFLTCLVMLTQASRCKPEPRPQEKVYLGPFMLDSARDYIAFTPGSWWIYENNRTNERDTVTVLSSQIFMKTFQESKVKDGKYYIVEIEDYKSRLYSTQSKRVDNYERGYPCINCVAFPQNDTGKISIIKGQSGVVRYFFKPKQVKYDEFYPLFIINGNTYKMFMGFIASWTIPCRLGTLKNSKSILFIIQLIILLKMWA